MSVNHNRTFSPRNMKKDGQNTIMGNKNKKSNITANLIIIANHNKLINKLT